MIPTHLHPSTTSPNKDLKDLQWNVFVEKPGIWGAADFTKNGFVDHINTTKDTTDYLWYTTRFVDNVLLLLKPFYEKKVLQILCKNN